ncbi:hypothetical protein [Conexibacter sp. CPCC 206217]|uniref:hypothetical protein n=1 Tax=Conexibacter sp. CPCC 206217 TaxID=3064574 RepID=UPI002727E499|nr:hypothetical protein [Conexibacter sp. CPCC 206217]MDO8209435.1 hypothetical protein [Conexibacter sp. CPCC 206217]
MSASNPGVPPVGGREAAAGEAAPTVAQATVSVPLGAPAGPPPPKAPLTIPGLPLDRPELHVGAAFAGGLLLATVLKRFAR